MNARSIKIDIGWRPRRRETWSIGERPWIGRNPVTGEPMLRTMRKFFYVRVSEFTYNSFRVVGYRMVKSYICSKNPIDIILLVRIPFCYPMAWARRVWRFARFVKQKSWIGYHPGNRGQYGLVINEGGKWFGVCIRYVPSNNWIQVYFVIIWRHKPHRFSRFIKIPHKKGRDK